MIWWRPNKFPIYGAQISFKERHELDQRIINPCVPGALYK